MTIDIPAPQMPELDAAWIQRRAMHLVAEITRDERRGSLVTGRRVLVGAGAMAVVAGAAGLSVGLLGPGTSDAFAGWVPTPSASGLDQTARAEAACQNSVSGAQGALAPSHVSLPDSTLPPVALTDSRGPFDLLVLSSPSSTVLCLTSSAFTAVSGGGGGSNLGQPAAGTLAVDRILFTEDKGQPYTVINGRVGDDVTKVVLDLSDGSTVEASTGNGRFAAWWPSDSGVAAAEVTGAAGTRTQSIGIASPSQVPNGPPTSGGAAQD